MKDAHELQEALDRDRQLCQQVEQFKHRLVGGDSFPVKPPRAEPTTANIEPILEDNELESRKALADPPHPEL